MERVDWLRSEFASDLAEQGIERVPRVTGVKDGQPLLEDGRRVEVANVVWCTGFRPNFSWIDLPNLDPEDPARYRGLVEKEPGLFFVGLKFLHSVSSEQIHGVGRDAERIADAFAARRREGPPARSASNRQDKVATGEPQRS